jgi:hypothetical protein
MPIILNTLYDALSITDDNSADVFDNVYGHCVCWDIYDDYEPISICMNEVMKQIDVTGYGESQYGAREFTADIASFVKKHMHDLYVMSQRFKQPMLSDDPEDDESVYIGVTIIDALQPGYGADDDYLLLLKKINEDLYWKWMRVHGGDWLEANAEYVEVMWNEVVTDAINEWPDVLPVKEEKKEDDE